MKISASLIVKNEEQMLPKCLKSIQQVDEIVIVDTGSEDKTIEIAKTFGAKVYTDYKWADNFAEARNVSKNQCSGDWLLIIDADEILETPLPVVREYLDKIDKDTNGIFFTVKTGKEKNQQIRLFRNKLDIQWVGAAHNLPYMIKDNRIIRLPGIVTAPFSIKSNFSPNHLKDPDRTLRIMSNEISKGPHVIGEMLFTRYLYYVAREWINRKDPIKALYFFEEYTKIAPPTNELADAWFVMATCYLDLGKLKKALEACMQSLIILPHFKAAWAMLHNLAIPKNQKIWERVFHLATNDEVLFVRQEAERLIKQKEQKNQPIQKPKK